MTETQKWPILHILVGIPIVLTIAALIGAALEGWNVGKVTVLYGATMTTPVGMAYTFLVALVERSYYMVFWAREKIREEMKRARADAIALKVKPGVRPEVRPEVKPEVRPEVRRGASPEATPKWRAWYERMQAAQREGRPFDEPLPRLRRKAGMAIRSGREIIRSRGG